MDKEGVGHICSEIMLFAATQMDLEIIVLNEVSLIWKTYHVISLIYGV